MHSPVECRLPEGAPGASETRRDSDTGRRVAINRAVRTPAAHQMNRPVQGNDQRRRPREAREGYRARDAVVGMAGKLAISVAEVAAGGGVMVAPSIYF